MNAVGPNSHATQSPAGIPEVQLVAERITREVEKVIIGKRKVIQLAIAALLSEGHLLLEDVPGIGKTMLARSLAQAVGGEFSRIQFTPDLLPTDITGSLVFDPKITDFVFRQGPIVANVLLADEVNRAGPRTQSALLEAMEERQISVERHRLPMPRPFFVVATQNPIELEGMFPLPEAQMDRFLMRLSIGYPELADEREVLRRFRDDTPLAHVQPVATRDDLIQAMTSIRGVHISEAVEGYLLAIVRGTRNGHDIELGASTRAGLALARASQAEAALAGRSFVLPDDVGAMAGPVLAHRLVASVRADLHGSDTTELVERIVKRTPAPVESTGRVLAR